MRVSRCGRAGSGMGPPRLSGEGPELAVNCPEVDIAKEYVLRTMKRCKDD